MHNDDCTYYPFKALQLLYVPLVLTLKNSTFFPQDIYIFLYVSQEKHR